MSTIDQTQPAVGIEPSPASRKSRKRIWLRLVLYPLLAYVVWCGVLYVAQDKMVFPRDAAAPPLKQVPFANTVVMKHELAGGGQVEAWFVPAPGVSDGHRGPVVVFCHGNCELIDHQGHVVAGYHRLGCSVLLPEYRGYGRDSGYPSQAAITSDVIRFYDEMLQRKDVDAARIVIHGRSLGGGVAAQLAARRKPAALILESSFASVACFSHRYLAPEFLAKNPFRTDEVLPWLDVPVLICHGTHDSVVPIEHARRNRELARKATYVEYNCDHNDFPGPGNDGAFWGEIGKFLSKSGIIGDGAGRR
jgi:fermentation-respiration switch protein FrsA (DUF1100 family)